MSEIFINLQKYVLIFMKKINYSADEIVMKEHSRFLLFDDSK